MKKIVLGTIALVMTQAANAAIITVNGSFTATNWSVYFGSPAAPLDPLSMSYSATFDDTITYEADTSVLTILSTNVPYPVTFSAAAGGGTLVIATDGASGSCTHIENSFCAFVSNYATGTPYFVEQSPAGGGGWVANTITANAVPEPASWAMMIGGFGLVGATMRRRRSVAVAA